MRVRPSGRERAGSRPPAAARRRAPTAPARSSRLRHAPVHVPHRHDVVDAPQPVDEPVDPGQPAGQIRALHARSRPGRAERPRARSRRAPAKPREDRASSSRQVATSATGRSRLMWAFIPASANWSGAIPRRERCANNGTQAGGVLPAPDRRTRALRRRGPRSGRRASRESECRRSPAAPALRRHPRSPRGTAERSRPRRPREARTPRSS